MLRTYYIVNGIAATNEHTQSRMKGNGKWMNWGASESSFEYIRFTHTNLNSHFVLSPGNLVDGTR